MLHYEQEKLEKIQEVKEEAEEVCKVMTTVVPNVIRALMADRVAPTDPKNTIKDLQGREKPVREKKISVITSY